MKDFNEIYSIVEESGHETSYNRGQAEALYNILCTLPNKARVVEIGVEYGRSTTVIAEVGKVKQFDFCAIDSWLQDNSAEARDHVLTQREKYGWDFAILSMAAKEAIPAFGKVELDLIHIDNGHTYEEVKEDCRLWLNKVKKGGYALFDDYGTAELPGVYEAVTEYMEQNPNWHFEGKYGGKLGIFKKVRAGA